MQFWLTLLIQGLLQLRQGRQQRRRQRSAVPHRSEALQKQNQHPFPGGNPTATPWDSSWEAADFTSGHSAMLLLQRGQAPFCCTGLWGSHRDAQPTCGHWWVHPTHNHGWSEVSFHWAPQRFGSRQVIPSQLMVWASCSYVAKETTASKGQGRLDGNGVCVTGNKASQQTPLQTATGTAGLCRVGGKTIPAYERAQSCHLNKSQAQERCHLASGGKKMKGKK